MISILVILSFILMIFLNIFGYSSEKKLLKRIDELDERLSVLDGGSKILKKYIKHAPEVRICDLENRLLDLESSDLIRKHQNKELEDTKQVTQTTIK